MKKIILILSLILILPHSFAQTKNFSLRNEAGTGEIRTINIAELDGTAEATIQMWFKAIEFTPGAKLFSQDNLSIGFGANSTIEIESAGQKAFFVLSTPLNSWNQLTIVVKNGTVNGFINNIAQLTIGTLPSKLPSSVNRVCSLMQGFKGELDEIRVWNKAMEQKDFFWRNTLNKFNPNYNALVAYWKADQVASSNLVDYKLKYHASLIGISRKEVTDNVNFRYRVVTGYTNLMRFIDRPNINRDMFLMTNDLILLSAKVQEDGSLFLEYPDNSAVPTKVEYLASYNGRSGVMNFKGTGSKMVSADGNAPFSPTYAHSRGDADNASIAGWIYIENWVEGAKIFSKYKDASNQMVISLGSEADKSIVVNFNGMIGTLKNKVQVGKWHYLGVYFSPGSGTPDNIFVNPISIGVDYVNYDRFSGLALTGASINVSKIPSLSTTPIVLGENFDGKMDELMVWGADRKGSARNDAEKGYKLNIGDWGSIFLNAYWKGDDPAQIGKDSQSLKEMANFIRKQYYGNHEGFKIRIGLIYNGGSTGLGWKTILNNETKLNRFVADCRKLLEYTDGIDVDLEWSYSASDYAIFNKIVHRLADVAMEGYRDTKTFSVSLHEVSYSIDKALFNKVDYFTVQLYGPHTVTYTWDWYVNAYNKLMNYGFPKNKTLMSYGVLLVNKGEEGYKDLFEKYGMNDSNYDPNLNVWNCAGTMKYFNGVTQTKRKQDFIIDKDLLGTMYFDMGNDQKMTDHKSLIRAQNDIIASNVDTIINNVQVPTGIFGLKLNKDIFSFYPNPAQDFIFIKMKALHLIDDAEIKITSLDGKLVLRERLLSLNQKISLTDIPKGTYVLSVISGNYKNSAKLTIN